MVGLHSPLSCVSLHLFCVTWETQWVLYTVATPDYGRWYLMNEKNVIFLSGCSGDAPILYVQLNPTGMHTEQTCCWACTFMYGADSRPFEQIFIITGDLLPRIQLHGGLLQGDTLIGISQLLGKWLFLSFSAMMEYPRALLHLSSLAEGRRKREDGRQSNSFWCVGVGQLGTSGKIWEDFEEIFLPL